MLACRNAILFYVNFTDTEMGLIWHSRMRLPVTRQRSIGAMCECNPAVFLKSLKVNIGFTRMQNLDYIQ